MVTNINQNVLSRVRIIQKSIFIPFSSELAWKQAFVSKTT